MKEKFDDKDAHVSQKSLKGDLNMAKVSLFEIKIKLLEIGQTSRYSWRY